MTISKSQKKDNGHWLFPEQVKIENIFGFVYLIRNRKTNMMYIGKKIFRGTGKINRGKPSNWRVYTSSSKDINALIEERGIDSFEFYVLEQYYTRGGLSWSETWSQCHVEVPTNNHIWYNRFIDRVQWRSSEIVSLRHRKRLNKLAGLK